MVKVGILGAGGMGNVHARQYRKMPAVELAFFDPDPSTAEAFIERWDCGIAANVEEIFDNCDIVDICLPTDLHLEFGLKAIASGAAVFIEKPLARSVKECETLISAADAARVPFMPGHVVRFFPEFATGNRLVKSGKLGTPAAARTRRGGTAPTGAGAWFMDHSRSGGILLDLAIHDFDWLRWTLGEVKHLYAKSVKANIGTGPDYALTTLTFDSGAVGHVETTWMDPSGFRVAFEVACSEGLIQFDSRENVALKTIVAGKTFNEGAIGPNDDPYFLELSGFLHAIRSGENPPVRGEDGFMAVSIAEAALESAKTGKVVAPARLG